MVQLCGASRVQTFKPCTRAETDRCCRWVAAAVGHPALLWGPPSPSRSLLCAARCAPHVAHLVWRHDLTPVCVVLAWGFRDVAGDVCVTLVLLAQAVPFVVAYDIGLCVASAAPLSVGADASPFRCCPQHASGRLCSCLRPCAPSHHHASPATVVATPRRHRSPPSAW